MPSNKGCNFQWQVYAGIRIKLIDRGYGKALAKRYVIAPFKEGAASNQNVWIPNKHLADDGTIKAGENIDYVFRKSQRQLELAGYTHPIPGIKRKSEVAQ